jgi:TonB family protein
MQGHNGVRPEDDSRAIEALRFSLASDIVELVVLTADDPFLQTLREAVGPTRRLWHVPTSDKVSDLLVAGGVGILVLDVQAVHEMGPRFISEIKRQFPDLVVVVAGTREAETELAHLISDGTVYRFIHKPMSPARAKLFADAAVKKYEEQKRQRGTVAAVAAPRRGGLLAAIVCAALCALLGGIWLSRHSADRGNEPAAVLPAAGAPAKRAGGASLLAHAALALAANRLTAPAGDNALELYRQAFALDPGDADARAGIAEVHERLLSQVENALLGERLDEAAADLDGARIAGVDPGRLALLAAELAKARAQMKGAVASKRAPTEAAPAEASAHAEPTAPAVAPAATSPAAPARLSVPAAPTAPTERVGSQADLYAALALERVRDEHLIEPERDNARFYVEQALKADPKSAAALEAQQQLALGLLGRVRLAIERRDFAGASSSLEAASDVASPDNVEILRRALDSARRDADADAKRQLLKSAQERLREDRLVEPENDSAKYYLAALRSADPANSALTQITQELGARLVGKGRAALTSHQYDAARRWFDEAGAIGYAAPEASAARRDLDAALAQQAFLANVVNASQLELVKSVPPVYPRKAEQNGVEGWVELDFTLADSGAVKDIAVHAANPPGVFDEAAVGALLRWRYRPVLRDAKAVEQRARIRIRFTEPR